MKRNSRLILALIASTVGLGGVSTGSVSAAPPRSGAAQTRATLQAISRINKLRVTAVNSIQRTSSGRIALLEKLKARGADDSQIISVANASKASVTATRVRLQNQIDRLVFAVIVQVTGQEKNLPVITAGLLTELLLNSVADDLLAQVVSARDFSVIDITDAEIAALTAIDSKVAELTAVPAP